MLVKFAIEADAIDNSASAPAHVKRLLKQWAYCGVLVYPPVRDVSIQRRLDELDQQPRKVWSEAWRKILKSKRNMYRSYPMDEGNFTWDDIMKCEDLAGYDEMFEVAILEDVRATVLNIPEGEAKYCHNVEVLRLPDLDMSIEFERSESRSMDRIRINKPVEDLWRERFQRLAEHSHEIAIVDSYALRDNAIQGTAKLLALLDRDSRGCDVTLYASPPTELTEDAESIRRKLLYTVRQLNEGGIRSLVVRLHPEDDFRIYAHDRHVRFDRNVLQIGRGIRVFRYETVREATDLGYIVLKEGSVEGKENDLDKKAYCIATFSIPVGSMR